MADKTIKHFVFVPFFTHQDSRYPYDIYDVNFLSKQLLVAKNNVLRSLENQTNKNFEIVFFSNRYFFDEKYDFVFSTLRDSTTLPVKFAKLKNKAKIERPNFNEGDMADLVNAALNEYDFVIQTRIDFDDFVFKDGFADTQSKVDECENILAYGYCKGYMYFDGVIYPNFWLWRGQGHIGIFQSLIMKSSFAKSLPFFSIYRDHSRFLDPFKNFLENNGVKFSESMFQQNSSDNAYIYFRSEFSHNNLVTNPGHLNKLRDNPKTNPIGITKKYLEEEFGFEYELKSIK